MAREYAGKWVAWDSRRTEILKGSERLEDLLSELEAAGITDAVFERIPLANVRLVGGKRR